MILDLCSDGRRTANRDGQETDFIWSGGSELTIQSGLSQVRNSDPEQSGRSETYRAAKVKFCTGFRSELQPRQLLILPAHNLQLLLLHNCPLVLLSISCIHLRRKQPQIEENTRAVQQSKQSAQATIRRGNGEDRQQRWRRSQSTQDGL